MAQRVAELRDCAPVLVVRDVPASVDYYRDALGFDVAFTPTGPAIVEANTLWSYLRTTAVGDTPFPVVVEAWRRARGDAGG